MAAKVAGLVSYYLSLVASALWLAWVVVPDSWLQVWGLRYCPDRWWALAVPTYIVVTFVFIVYAYVAVNMMATCPIDSVDLIRDSSTSITCSLYGEEGEIPNIEDVDLTIVNKLLFPPPGQQSSPRLAATAEAASAVRAESLGQESVGTRYRG
mmetsp:Transcript_40241/g.85825  ORF Transcript_40241/g.85825 Transcript_40241/m.85825 type:complete len:153 (-) Transcript_40241:23-481(-)